MIFSHHHPHSNQITATTPLTRSRQSASPHLRLMPTIISPGAVIMLTPNLTKKIRCQKEKEVRNQMKSPFQWGVIIMMTMKMTRCNRNNKSRSIVCANSPI
eukprot:PhF_6_TR39720/c0_g1_i2/m.59131